MKSTEYREGADASARFVGAMRKILSVPRAEILRREAEYKKQSALNINRRGPKRKSFVVPAPGAQPLS
jgi:hypothetical protein